MADWPAFFPHIGGSHCREAADSEMARVSSAAAAEVARANEAAEAEMARVSEAAEAEIARVNEAAEAEAARRGAELLEKERLVRALEVTLRADCAEEIRRVHVRGKSLTCPPLPRLPLPRTRGSPLVPASYRPSVVVRSDGR